ncbi:MAG: hypothetical protein PHS45_03805 [Bacilli bacterium]|nr:hypothetical protein [Bacilli bacterium]
MNVKMIIPIIGSILLGYFFGNIIFKEYRRNTGEVFSQQENVYFLQQGVYSSIKSLEEHTKSIQNYIYEKDGDFYRVYVALTKNHENALKLEELYEESGNDIYIRELPLKNKNFLNILEQYDNLIKETNDNNNLLIIAREVLIKYKELVVDSEASIN